MTQDILFIDAHSQEELFDLVSKALIKQHYVSPDYRQAVKEREREFPTGLKIDLKMGLLFNMLLFHTLKRSIV